MWQISTLQSKRILITGATGFIGRCAGRVLNDAGATVFGIARHPPAVTPSYIDLHTLDMLDAEALKRLMCELQPQFVIHLAASRTRVADVGAFREGYDLNLKITLNLVEACLSSSALPHRLIYLGSCEEYGQCKTPFEESMREAPASAYGASKLAATQLLQVLARSRNFPAVILRPSVVYGPEQHQDMFLPALITALLGGDDFAMTAGEQTRDYVYLEDVVEAIASSLVASLASGTIINIGSGVPIQMKQLALVVAQCIGCGAQDLLRPGERNYRPGEPMEYWASNTIASRLLGWRPCTPLDVGIARTVASFRERVRAQPG